MGVHQAHTVDSGYIISHLLVQDVQVFGTVRNSKWVSLRLTNVDVGKDIDWTAPTCRAVRIHRDECENRSYVLPRTTCCYVAVVSSKDNRIVVFSQCKAPISAFRQFDCGHLVVDGCDHFDL